MNDEDAKGAKLWDEQDEREGECADWRGALVREPD